MAQSDRDPWGAGNHRVDEQADLVFDAVNAVNGALDGLVVWFVEREGIDAGAERKSVGFPALRAKGPLKKMGRGIFALPGCDRGPTDETLHPILQLASDVRIKGYHFHPLLTSVLQFPELLEVTDPDITSRVAGVRVFDKAILLVLIRWLIPLSEPYEKQQARRHGVHLAVRLDRCADLHQTAAPTPGMRATR